MAVWVWGQLWVSAARSRLKADPEILTGNKGTPGQPQLLLLRPAIDPIQDDFVPLDGVQGFEHPVIFVGEVEQARGHAHALQGVEHRQALGVDDTVVEGAVDEQLRGL